MNIPEYQYIVTYLNKGKFLFQTEIWDAWGGPTEDMIKREFEKQNEHLTYTNAKVIKTGRETLWD